MRLSSAHRVTLVLAILANGVGADTRAEVNGGDPSPPALAPISLDKLPAVFSARDEAFDIQLAENTDDKNERNTFAYVEREFHRDPQPQAKAVYAEMLIAGRELGAPEGQEQRGIALGVEALQEGNIHALSVLGWALMRGTLVQRDLPRGWDWVNRGAKAGDPRAMLLLGTAYLNGVGVEHDLGKAESWFHQAGIHGEPEGLLAIARAYLDGRATGHPNMPVACRSFYSAYIHGVYRSRFEIEALAEQGFTEASRVSDLITVWRVLHGHDLPHEFVARSEQSLEENYPKDPEVLVALGDLYADGLFRGFFDLDKAMAFYERATALGSQEARSRRAGLLAEGRGVKKDPARALAEWKALDLAGVASASAQLGYYRYWGSLGVPGWGKNEALAFMYSKRAEEGGDPFGAYNLGSCYSDGVGVAKDYGQAGQYYWVAYKCRLLQYGFGQNLIDGCLAFVK